MTDAPQNNQGYSGQQGLTDDKTDFNALTFVIEQMLGNVRTATLVKVMAVDGVGADSPVGFVDVQPLVNQVDGALNSTPHGVVVGLPYFRLQGGANAVVLDPAEGDIGIALFCDRDISAVKSTKAQGNPGSRRRFNFADGIYLGGILNGAPTQYVAFTEDGISLSDRNGHKIEMLSDGIHITGDVFVTGNVQSGTGPSKITLRLHTHPGNNAPPTPGA